MTPFCNFTLNRYAIIIVRTVKGKQLEIQKVAKMKLLKKITGITLALGIATSNISSIYANVYIDEIVETQTVASGIEYSNIHQLTTDGFIDIKLLKIDLDNPNVDFDILRNESKFGVQQTLTNLVGDTTKNNVVGAVNGSFFFTDTTPTDMLGYEYENDQFTFMKERYNKEKFEENSIIITKGNDVGFGYLQANTIIYNSKGESERIVSVNGSRDLIHMTLVSKVMMKDSTQIEALGNIYKWVIEDGVVTNIVEPKTVVAVPENGYLLTVNYNSGANMKAKFPIGERVNIALTTSFDSMLDDVKILFGGAGNLVKNGTVQLDGLSASPNLRAPRTSVGVSKNGNTMYIVAVDGRGASIGMTNKEIAEYMKSIGAYNAINLDGGGSTTFAVREEGQTQTKVINKPSDGNERKIINGFGVTTSPTGQLARLKVVPSTEKALVGQSVTFKVTGFDINDNPVAIDSKLISVRDVNNVENIISGNSISFNDAGIKLVEIMYGELMQSVIVDVYDNNTVNFEIEPISVGLAGKSAIEIKATTSDGYLLPIDESKVNFVTNGNFTVANGNVVGGFEKGTGTLTATIGDKTFTGNVSVGASSIYLPLSSFEGAKVSSKPYPDGKEGATGVYKEKPLAGSYAIKTSFNFKANGKAQAVYSILDGVKIEDSRAEKLSINYHGDNKKNSVKAIVKDSKGTEKVLVFTNSVDFTGYKRLEADIPDGLVYPIVVDRLYVASTGASAISGTGYFDYLTYTIGDSFIASQNTIDLSYDSLNNKTDIPKLFNVTHKTNGISENFETTVLNNTKIIKVPSDSGSITFTNSANYNKLKAELYSASQKNIVIVTNQSILGNTFSVSEEGIMLKNMIDTYASKYTKNIYYINNRANVNDTDLINGIRYIDLYDKDLAFGLDANGNLTYKSIN